MGDYWGLPRWAQCNHRGPYRRKAGGSESQEEMGQHVTAGFGGGGRGPGVQACGQPHKLEKARELIADTWTLAY